MRIFCPILVSAVLIASGVCGCGPAGGPPEETLPTDGATNTTDAAVSTDAPPGQSEPESDGQSAEPVEDSAE